MTDRIDHAEEAVTWLKNAKSAQASSEPYNEQLATAYAGIAQGHATLALVEQQRIANRIALASTVAAVEMKYMQHGCRDHLLGGTGLFDHTINPEEALLKPEIKEGLGL